MDQVTQLNNGFDDLIDNPVSENHIEASKGIRLANNIIDSIVFYILILPVGIYLIFSQADSVTTTLINYFINFIILFLYYILFEGVWGKSIGKMLTGTKVINEDGGQPTFSQIAIRTLCRFIPFEAFSFLGEGTGWHDSLSKTCVVKVR